MNISRVMISRQHLKKIKSQHLYDGIRKYKNPKKNPEITKSTVIVLYDIYRTMINENSEKH